MKTRNLIAAFLLVFSTLIGTPRIAYSQEAPAILFDIDARLFGGYLYGDGTVSSFIDTGLGNTSWTRTFNEATRGAQLSGTITPNANGSTLQMNYLSWVNISVTCCPILHSASAGLLGGYYYVRKDKVGMSLAIRTTDSYDLSVSDAYASVSGLASNAELPPPGPGSGSNVVVYKTGEIGGATCGLYFAAYPGVEYCPASPVEGSSSYSSFTNTSGPRAGSASSNMSTTKEYIIGDVFDPEPGDPPNDDRDNCEGQGPKSKTDLNPRSLNLHDTSNDPITTRGYPLTLNIHVNSQVVENSRPLGNASFTYDIHISNDKFLSNHRLVPFWVLVDGDGTRLKYGPQTAAPSPEPGVYGVLTQTSYGYLLSDAGPPENLRSAGNYQYKFDSAGKLTEVKDPAGNVQQLAYDVYGKIISVTDIGISKSITFQYTGNRITRIVEAGGAAFTDLTYTTILSKDYLTSITVKEPSLATTYSTQYTYSTTGLLSSITRDNDPTTTKQYTYQLVSAVRPGEQVPIIVTADGETYSRVSQQGYIYTTRTDHLGYVTKYKYDQLGDIQEIRLPTISGGIGDFVSNYYHDSKHNLTDTNGTPDNRVYAYNDKGFISTITDGQNVINYIYSGLDLISITDSIGRLYDFAYESASLPHNPTTVTDPGGNQWQYVYNSYGQVTAIIPPAGSQRGTTLIEYETSPSSSGFGYVKKTTDGSGLVVNVLSYSALGDPTQWSTTPATGVTHTESATYDAGRRLKSKVNGDGTSQQATYNGRNISSSKDELNSVTSYEFCPSCGGLKKLLRPLASNLEWVRNANHDVTSFIDARGKSTTYTIGGAREVKEEIHPDGTKYTYQYDTSGRPEFKTLGTGTEVERIYWWDFSLPYINAYQGNGANNLSEAFSYTLDKQKSVSYISGHPGSRSLTYYPNRLLQSELIDLSWGGYDGVTATERIEYDYYPDNLRKALRWYHNNLLVASWSYTYDGAGRLKTVANSFGETTTYTYDGEGKLTDEAYANGTKVRYTYNNQRGFVTKIELLKGTTVLTSFTLTRDAVGKITQVVEKGGTTTTYVYDALYRLTKETTGTTVKNYTYDLAGNLLTRTGVGTMTYDAANKLATIGGGSVTHDAAGRILSLSGTGVIAGTYAWWANGRLQSQVGGGANLGHEYNPEGDRLATSVTGNLSGTKRYVYADGMLIGELTGPSPSKVYTLGLGYVSQRDLVTAKSHWLNYGPQGETRNLVDSTGALVSTYRYNAYGVRTSTSGTVTSPFGYAGKYGCYTEGGTGLILCGHRWYNPQIGRWMMRDPIGYDGGEDQYAYVGGDPVNFVDSDGLEPGKGNNGERGQAGSAGGTGNPSKHWKEDPKRPGWGWQTNPQTGKKIYKPRPPYIPDPNKKSEMCGNVCQAGVLVFGVCVVCALQPELCLPVVGVAAAAP